VRSQERAAARRYVEQRLEQELPPDELDGIRAVYVVLGLIPDTLDLRALLLDLYTEQVLGYYDPRTRTLYVVGDASDDAVRPVVAHELVHALQDQHTNLDSLIARERGNDRQTAAHAALEGHAMVVMFTTLHESATGRPIDPVTLPSPARELGPALKGQSEQFPVFRRAPGIVRETLLFPYVAGSDFVHTLWSHRRGAERYPAPLDSLLPQSTQQVMEPVEHFIRHRTEPIELRFDGVPGDLGIYSENTLGQLETAIFLGHHRGAGARAVASGWRGDRYLVMREGGENALLWVTVWASPQSAQRFADALRKIARPQRTREIELLQLNAYSAVRFVDTPTSEPRLREQMQRITVRLAAPR
jgi:hypothetical protein